jgi:uncharacterized protein
MLRAQIYEDVKAAMKAQDRDRLDVVRYVWSEIKRVEIDAKHELTDEEVVELLRKEVKRRREAVEQMKQAGRNEVVEREEQQLTVIDAYLPQLMNEEEVERVVDEVLAQGLTDFGKVMGVVMGRLKGKADGGMVQRVVKQRLNL